jgi:hypothetical protein
VLLSLPTLSTPSEAASSGNGTLTPVRAGAAVKDAAVPVNGPWQEFAFTVTGALATGCAPADPTASGCAPSAAGNSAFVGPPPWTFDAGPTGVTLTVTDAFAIGDRFEVFDHGVSLGQTSAVAVNGGCGDNPVPCLAAASHATFSLGSGSHSITIAPTASPFRGGAAYFQVTTGPSCRLTGTGTIASRQFIQVTTQDLSSGLANIQVTQSTNVTVQVPAFSVGTHDAVVVTATKVDQSIGSRVALRVTNKAGQAVDCDPVMVNVGRQPGQRPVQIVKHLSQRESQVTIVNATPGVNTVRLLVNGHQFMVTGLQAGDTRSVDVSAAMHNTSDNTIVVVVHGPAGGSAAVVVSN